MGRFDRFGRYTKADRQKLCEGNWLSLVEGKGLVHVTAWHDGTFGCSKKLCCFIDELDILAQLIDMAQKTLDVRDEHVVLTASLYKKLKQQEAVEVAEE